MTLWRRLRYLLPSQRDAAERDMLRELQSLAEMAQPGELGNLTRAAEDARAEWGWTRLEQTKQDVRYGLRALWRSPGFTATAVVSLALGIGANAAVFSSVRAVLLQPLPYPESDRLVRIVEHRPPDAGSELGYPQQVASVPIADLPTLRAEASTLSHVGAYAGTTMTLTGRGETVRVKVARVSPSVLAMLGVSPPVGRTFAPREETPGLDTSVILSHAAWERYLGTAQDVLEQHLTLDGRVFAVIGVMPESFTFPDPQIELWVPYALAPPRGRVAPIARLADGASLQTASAQVSAIVGRLQPAVPSRKASSFDVQRVQALLVAPVRPALVVFSVAVGAVLLIACVNVANLLLARATVRRRELAVRQALGAGPGRLARQLFVESVLLAAAGGVVGTLLAYAGVHMLRALGTGLPRTDLTPGVSIPRLDEVGLDPRVLVMTLAVATLTSIVFGVVPTVRGWSSRLTDDLRDRAASAGGHFSLFRRHRARGALVAGQIALAMLLLVGSGLLAGSFIKLSRIPPGYDPVNLLTFNVPAAGRPRASFNDELVARLRSLPGVRAAGYAELMPMVRFRSGIPIRPVPAAPAGLQPPGPLDTRIVSRGFLPAMGVQVLAGRGFSENDSDGQPRVAVINDTLARSGFLGPRPLGARLQAGPFVWDVVGIVADVHQYGLDQKPDPQVFFDIRQLPAGNPNPYFAVRVERSPSAVVPAIRRIVRELDAAATVDNVATMNEVVSNSMSRPRLVAVLLGIFAGIAGVLALVGIYGLIAYSVAERTREFGIRLALGATRADVIGLVMRQSAVLLGVGLAVGLAGAAAVTRQLQDLLFGLSPLDPATFLIVSGAFSVVAALATYIPGRRATTVDPMIALRSD